MSPAQGFVSRCSRLTGRVQAPGPLPCPGHGRPELGDRHQKQPSASALLSPPKTSLGPTDPKH